MHKELRLRPRHVAGAGDRARAGPERLAESRRSRSGAKGGRHSTVPTPSPATPTPPPPPPQAVPAQGRLPQGEAAARWPPGAYAYAAGHHTAAAAAAARRPARDLGGGHGAGRGRVPATGAQSEGREATGGAPRDGRRGRGRAHTARREGKGTDTAPRPAAAGENRHTGQARVRAADDGTQDTAGKGQGHGKDAGASSSATGRAQ